MRAEVLGKRCIDAVFNYHHQPKAYTYNNKYHQR